MKNKLWIFLLVLVAPLTTAEVFRIVDEYGNVTFTDSPPEGVAAEKVELPELVTQPAIEVPEASPADDSIEFVAIPTVAIRLVTPVNQMVVPPGQQTIPVEVSLSRQLEEDEVVHILYDNVLHSAGPSTFFTIDNLERGEHSVQARVVGAGRTVKAQSNIVTVFVQRATVLN